MPSARMSGQCPATPVLQTDVKPLSSTRSPLSAARHPCSVFNLLQRTFIIPIVLAVLLGYLQAPDDSFSFNKGMLGDKLLCTNSFASKKNQLNKHVNIELLALTRHANPLYYPPNHPVFTSFTQPK